MRNKIEFEQLVYERADILSAQNRRRTSYRRYLSAAAAVTVLTAAAAGSSLIHNNANLAGAFKNPASNLHTTENTIVNRSDEMTEQNNGIALDNGAQTAENEDAALDEADNYSFDAVQKSDEYSQENPDNTFDGMVTNNQTKAAAAESRSKAAYTTATGDHFEVTDPDKAQEIISQLRSAEQVRPFSDDQGEYLGKIETEVSSEYMTQTKEYLIFENTVTVSVKTHNNTDGSDKTTSYNFAATEQFLKLCEEYLEN